MLLFIDLTAEVDRMSSEGRVDLGIIEKGAKNKDQKAKRCEKSLNLTIRS
jgi:hypothetical protein